jgi:hypothetical protein
MDSGAAVKGQNYGHIVVFFQRYRSVKYHYAIDGKSRNLFLVILDNVKNLYKRDTVYSKILPYPPPTQHKMHNVRFYVKFSPWDGFYDLFCIKHMFCSA